MVETDIYRTRILDLRLHHIDDHMYVYVMKRSGNV